VIALKTTAGANPEFEAERIRRILAGEKHLFHDLMRPCERAIYFLQLSLLKNESEAEDGGWPTLDPVTKNGCPILESFCDSRVGDREPQNSGCPHP